ncbi:alanine--tRNA ligase [Segetibacter sp. 3557_3]|uniref:alanine--tRNA ligase n=1 Tax=Segetibacter sp. 3557_3 TaxID=2547429 RepID=UPI001058AFE2|nr:alanine--tRNA ligase [Segetibacter sp. 3557_3]TDH24091.1 alanine--tRNA ligase [Segetibacter sp. 3557_3]
MLTSAVIRQQFLDFFASKEHQIVPSASIVVKNDPTLLFTNAGMNQFKDFFLGNRKPDFNRIADTQKCLRVSGKHNDLEEVGVDTYHHTMFEMLGNWSFGDYFKKEAIAWSWELLTEVYKLDKNRLYVTVFEGDTKEGLPKDEEAEAEWKKWIDPDRILGFAKKDNFWEMGDTGPCGPCTEIHVDGRSEEERKAVDGRTLVNQDHPQVIEIWNNVFIQFNRLKNGSLEPLPQRHVDTGMGFERLVRVLQEKHSNYDTDIFAGTISAIEGLTGKKYLASESKSDVAFRVLADHLRAISFTIADGQLPSNTGAGYVIRRVLRRAVRYYYSYLDYKQPLLQQLVPVLATQFENVFSELKQQQEFVSKVVKEEEEAFLRTLDKGLKKIDEIFAVTSNAGTRMVDGKAAFELFDTFGFPLDLTKLIASEHGLDVDEAGFNAEMQQQKNRSRAASTLDTEDWIVLDDYSLSDFVGYDSLEIETRVIKYRKVSSKGKTGYQLILEATPFYAESGGQVGDQGVLLFGEEQIRVTDTKKENNLIVHFIDALPTRIDAPVLARVDIGIRRNTEAHHTATHLLHAALREVLGSHVAQKGSLVNDEHLRFDFSHFAKITEEEISRVEAVVNSKIRQNISVVIKEMDKDEAVQMGAMALFGEKYGDRVRVVIIDPAYSVELCGGTHVTTTGELGFFKIEHESAVAAGVRRIEAVSGTAAINLVNETFRIVDLVKETLKNPKDLQKAIENLQLENTELRKKVESLEARQLAALARELAGKSEQQNGSTFIGQIVEVSSADALKKLCFELKKVLDSYLVVLATAIDGKSYVAVMLDESTAAAKNLEAPKIIKEHISVLIKGGGGGQKTLATAGGQETGNLPAVIDKVRSLL